MVGPEMLVAAAVNQVARKINDAIGVAQGDAKLCCTFSDDLERIKDTMVYLEGLLKNAENNSFGSERANLRHWLGQIKSLAYDIEDIVDGYYSSKEEFEGSSYIQKGSLFCSLSNPMFSKVGMVYKMKSKRELLQTRQQLPTQYHFISHINSAVNFDEKQTTSYRNKDTIIVGRDRDLEQLMGMLMQVNVQEISIISIVGPVGFGKTSLTQLVYNDARAEKFSFRIWVHVSMGNINIAKIGRDIVSQTGEMIEGNMQMQSIKKAVQDILNKHNCLVVLDSLWGKDEQVNELRQMLLTGKQTTSKIIVTTHSEKVAELISTVPPYKLSVLSEGDCSSIFSKRAMTSPSDPLFREYGEEIVRRCEGIPLVANFLGSVVNAQRQRREIWQVAKDQDMWKIEEDYPLDRISPIFPSFKIIYYNMPHELRLCFVYCSIFPKGSVIEKKKLIQQWIALDMIESKHGTLPLDVTAEKYIDELKAIHFLQVSHRAEIAEVPNGSEEILSMNNLAHDLARSVAGEDILVILDTENEHGTRNYDYRYAQVSASSLQSIDSKAWPSKARSLIFKTSGAELQHVNEVLSKNKYLRVLDLRGCSVTEIPSPIFQLKQLRYLDASTLPITTLPPQVSGFHKLQSLDLSETELIELPPFISNLKMLNYLNLQGCKKLQQLNNLDMLHELHYLNLSCCPEVRSFPGSLANLVKLQVLNLSWCSKLPTLPEGLLQSFTNFSSIVDLDISGFEFQRLPDFFGSICSLQFLNMSKCSKLEVLPQSCGQLAYLRGLNLSFCSELKLLQSFECLTCLQFLNLSNCHSLQYLPPSFDKLISLEYLNLSQCFGLKALPTALSRLSKLRTLEVSGCQDCILQSYSLSSRCSVPYQCLDQAEEVASNSSFSFSEMTPEEPTISDVTGVKSGEASVLNIDEVEYSQNTVKKKSSSMSVRIGHKSKEIQITELKSSREIVELIPDHQIPLSPSYCSSFESSSSAPLASASTTDPPMSSGETEGLPSEERSYNSHVLAENGKSCENEAPSSNIPAHLHESGITRRRNDSDYSGEYHLSAQRDGPKSRDCNRTDELKIFVIELKTQNSTG